MKIKIKTSQIEIIPYAYLEFEFDSMGIDDILRQIPEESIIDYLEIERYEIHKRDGKGIRDMIEYLQGEGYRVEKE